jgi:hypothetical protein
MPGRILHDSARQESEPSIETDVADTIAMRTTGHKTRGVFDYYDITSDENLRRRNPVHLQLA